MQSGVNRGKCEIIPLLIVKSLKTRNNLSDILCCFNLKKTFMSILQNAFDMSRNTFQSAYFLSNDVYNSFRSLQV